MNKPLKSNNRKNNLFSLLLRRTNISKSSDRSSQHTEYTSNNVLHIVSYNVLDIKKSLLNINISDVIDGDIVRYLA